MFNRINKFFMRILKGTDVKNNDSYQWATESQQGASVHDAGTGYDDRARSAMQAERQFSMPLYEVAERAELSQNSMEFDDLAGTKKVKRW